ncbi:hypothetical protein KUTeg_009898 [Tegillarca granosa]|uniref:Uncharacterized protein n=1 Tax=Tegillarca granosa TaxID=220873 RepID=A0ABQ9FA78_TEGGR|nr:hypothetical protein KUTeg_009898 [Tegillarca granosa]
MILDIVNNLLLHVEQKKKLMIYIFFQYSGDYGEATEHEISVTIVNSRRPENTHTTAAGTCQVLYNRGE